jgi:hypothetical protein
MNLLPKTIGGSVLAGGQYTQFSNNINSSTNYMNLLPKTTAGSTLAGGQYVSSTNYMNLLPKTTAGSTLAGGQYTQLSNNLNYSNPNIQLSASAPMLPAFEGLSTR